MKHCVWCGAASRILLERRSDGKSIHCCENCGGYAKVVAKRYNVYRVIKQLRPDFDYQLVSGIR